MGYLHDVELSVALPMTAGQRTGVPCTVTRLSNGVYECLKDFAAETFQVVVPIELPASSDTKRAVRLASVDF